MTQASAIALLRQGGAHEMAGDLTGALAAYRAAARAAPAVEEAQYRAGNLLEFSGRSQEALPHFRRGARAASALAKICAGRAALLQGQNVEAARHFRQALAREPGNATAADWLGTVLSDIGDFAGASEAYAVAVREPTLAGSFYELVRCRKIGAADTKLIAAMENALADPGLPPQNRLRVHLARGKAADDLEDPALAMRHFANAAELRAKIVPFDPAAFGRLIDRLIAAFPAERFAAQAATPAADVPILVLGMPRSGTTLVEQILAAHPRVAAAGELPFWLQRGAQWCLGANGADFAAQAGQDYLALLRRTAPDASRITDKMPFNFLWAGLALLAVPGATIVHCRRDPADTALSIHRTHFHPHLRFPTGGAALVAYFAAYERLMRHWRRVLPAASFVEIGYEALATAPAPVVRRLLEACGLTWHEACLFPERNKDPVRTPSKWQVRTPIHTGSVGAWRRYAAWLGEMRALCPEDG